ncbi:hypothetical protein Pla100_37270 [Neorhodopirellula pilleata]|uniref:Uncharacterized protein n=1 Tax=Neorhodopirellula pilleata TaxID=2714738 RepID=A0A5C6A9Z4_9BACT|nr:hypothetical protein Pla100_37270 [Neorhodopirellula pilleata]
MTMNPSLTLRVSIAGTLSGGDFQSPNPETSTESRRHVKNPALIVHAMLTIVGTVMAQRMHQQ